MPDLADMSIFRLGWRLLLLFGLCSSLLRAQPFSIPSSPIQIAVAPGYNQVPLSVPLSYNPATFDLTTLKVSSDSSWVMPTIDSTNGSVVFTFVTANLIKSSYTATITLSAGATTQNIFINASLAPLNIVALKADPVRSRVYGLQQNGTSQGALVIFDPILQTAIGSVSLGNKPTDLAVSPDGSELLVICSASEVIYAINPQTLAVTQTIPLTDYSDWGPDSTSAHIKYGPSNILYYTDGEWAPVLHVLNRTTGAILQDLTINTPTGYGFGDLVVSPDKSTIFAWGQYGWSAGLANSLIAKYTVNADGTLNLAGTTTSPVNLSRDPLNTPAFISADGQTVVIKQVAISSANITNTLQIFASPIFAISPNAEIASDQSSIYQVSTGNKLAALPVTSSVQVITDDYARLVYFDSTAQALKIIDLFQAVGPAILGQVLAPANQSIVLPPSKLQWTSLPGINVYQVYLGQSLASVTQATPNSPAYLGQVIGSSFTLPTALTPGQTYYWRVDPVSNLGPSTGSIYTFTVSSIVSNISAINAETVHGYANYSVSLPLSSASTGAAWTATTPAPWIKIINASGTIPSTLQVVLDASQLNAGVAQSNITISSSQGNLTLPVTFKVDPLNLTVIRSDPATTFVYGVSEATGTQAYLLEIDTVNQIISRVQPIGSSVTDLAIHHGDNRIYVPNWTTGLLLAVNLTTFVTDQTYGLTPFQGVGYSTSDVYRVSAGVGGRLIYEAEDQWINVTLFDTVAGRNITTSFQREGGGQYEPSGRYYYHGDYNISNASLHKLDTLGDAFKEVANSGHVGVGYYGDRSIVVSGDGSRIFWNGICFDPNLNNLWSIGDIIYCTSSDGRLAFSSSTIYDTTQKAVVFGMPVNTAVSAYNSATGKLVVQQNLDLAYYNLSGLSAMPAPTLSGNLANNNSTINFTWTDHSLETSFTLQYRLSGNTDWTDISSQLPPNVVNYTFSNLTAGSSYDFRLKANSPSISSDWSNILTLTVPGPAATGGNTTGGNTTGGNFTGGNTTGGGNSTVPPPTIAVSLGSTSAAPGATITLPITVQAQGNENSLSFSLHFNTALLTFQSAAFGNATTGSNLEINAAQTADGNIGFALALPTGQTLPAGLDQILQVTFTLSSTAANTTTTVSFTNSPVGQGTSTVNATPVTATYNAGAVTIDAYYEGDVLPLPEGDGKVTPSDWVEIGRLVTGLDPVASADQFERADCAPRVTDGVPTLGDGQLTIADWVQAGRYVSNLDPPTPIGGPTSPVTPAVASIHPASASPARALSLQGPALTSSHANFTVVVALNALGNENALGFSVVFDPASEAYVSASLQSGGAGMTLSENDLQSAQGHVGFALILPAGTVLPNGQSALLQLTFAPLAAGNTSVSFGNQPVVSQTVDSTAAPLPTAYLGASVQIANPSIPSISAQPIPTTTVVGKTVSLSVSASAIPPLTYQWYKNRVAIPGATTATLVLTGVTTSQAGTFYVTVTSSAGTVASSSITLKVLKSAVAPRFVREPISIKSRLGRNVTFTARAIGTAPLAYQWQKEGVNLLNQLNIRGATSASLVLTKVTTANLGNYQVIVTNPASSVTSRTVKLTTP